MSHADYRKLNDGSHSSSTYHKKDGTPVRAILKRDLEAEQDALFLAASRAHHAFQEKHWTYLKARGRRHPETGELYVQPNPAIDNEAHRLWAAVRDANWVRNGSR